MLGNKKKIDQRMRDFIVKVNIRRRRKRKVSRRGRSSSSISQYVLHKCCVAGGRLGGTR